MTCFLCNLGEILPSYLYIGQCVSHIILCISLPRYSCTFSHLKMVNKCLRVRDMNYIWYKFLFHGRHLTLLRSLLTDNDKIFKTDRSKSFLLFLIISELSRNSKLAKLCQISMWCDNYLIPPYWLQIN